MKKRQTKKGLTPYERQLIYEGILDSLISILQKGGRAWSQYTSVDTGKVPQLGKDFNPKENLESQIHAVVCVLQHVGYAIENFDDSLSYMEGRLVEISQSSDDDQFFSQEVNYFFEYFDQYLIGQSVGWLQGEQLKRCSAKVYDVSQRIGSTDAVIVLEEISEVFREISRLDIPSQAKKVFDAKGAQNILKDTDFKQYYEETVPLFDKLDSVIDRLDPFKENIAAMIALAEEKAQSAEVSGDQEAEKGTVFESSFPKIADVLFF